MHRRHAGNAARAEHRALGRAWKLWRHADTDANLGPGTWYRACLMRKGALQGAVLQTNDRLCCPSDELIAVEIGSFGGEAQHVNQPSDSTGIKTLLLPSGPAVGHHEVFVSVDLGSASPRWKRCRWQRAISTRAHRFPDCRTQWGTCWVGA